MPLKLSNGASAGTQLVFSGSLTAAAETQSCQPHSNSCCESPTAESSLLLSPAFEKAPAGTQNQRCLSADPLRAQKGTGLTAPVERRWRLWPQNAIPLNGTALPQR